MWNYPGWFRQGIKSTGFPWHCGDDLEVKIWLLSAAMSPLSPGRANKWLVHNYKHKTLHRANFKEYTSCHFVIVTMYYVRPLIYDNVTVTLRFIHGFFRSLCIGYYTNCIGEPYDRTQAVTQIRLLLVYTIWATSWENLFMPYANNKGTDRPAHLRSLSSTFVVHCLDS